MKLRVPLWIIGFVPFLSSCAPLPNYTSVEYNLAPSWDTSDPSAHPPENQEVQLYSEVFSHITSTSLVVSKQHRGAVISLERGGVNIFTSSGEQISAWKWNNSPAVKVKKLNDCRELAYLRQNKLEVDWGAEQVLLSQNYMSVLELQQDHSIISHAKVVLAAINNIQTNLTTVLHSGMMWLGETLAKKLTSHELEGVRTAVAWCKEEAVLLTLVTGRDLLLHTSGEVETMFQPAPLAILKECDGVRILSQDFHDLIHKVDTTVTEIYSITSMSPGSIVLKAKSQKADEYNNKALNHLAALANQDGHIEVTTHSCYNALPPTDLTLHLQALSRDLFFILTPSLSNLGLDTSPGGGSLVSPGNNSISSMLRLTVPHSGGSCTKSIFPMDKLEGLFTSPLPFNELSQPILSSGINMSGLLSRLVSAQPRTLNLLQIWCKLCELGPVGGQFSCTKHGNGKIAIRHFDNVDVMVIIRDGNIDPVDSDTPTMFHISEHGDLLWWFDCADYMRKPPNIAMGGRKFYVCDFKGCSEVVFTKDGVFVKGIGCENITNFFKGFVKLKFGSPHHFLVMPSLRNSLRLLHEEILLAAVIGLLEHVEGKLRSYESSKLRSYLLLSGDIESNPGPPRTQVVAGVEM